MAALTERHRPTSYAEVVGQRNGKALLRAAAVGINGDARFRGRSVLLFGPDGTGKTCLANIYARALLCTGRLPDAGEACGACRDCDRAAKGQHPNLVSLNEEQLQSQSTVERIEAAAGSHAWSGGWTVILIDGADCIPGNVFDALHRRIENHPAGVTFILTASDHDAVVPRRSRDLLLRIEVGEVGVLDREQLLRRVAGAEAIELTEEALRLLARQGSGRPRALLNSLETLALCGPVVADEVRAHFRDVRTERALIYFERVLARSSLKDQLAALRDEGDFSPSEVGALIRGVLTSILGPPALGLSEENLPIAFEAARVRTDLGAALLQRGADLRLGAREMFSRLVAWWSASIEDESALIARVNDFDEWLNGPAQKVEHETAIGFRTMDRRRRPKDELQALEAGRGGVASARRQARSADYLSRTDVQRIWDAASFLIQKHGLYLNGRLSLCWGPGGQDDEAEIAGAIFGLQHELRQWALRQEKARTEADMKFHRVRIHARDAEGARWTHWGLASRHNLDVGGWVEGYRGRSTKPLAIATKMEWEPGPRSGQSALDRHHEVLAYLLAGIEPGWRVQAQDELGRTTDIPVSELLGIGTQRAAGKRFMKSRIAVSRYIDREYRSRASPILPPLSLFDEQLWGSALSGWEVAEHDYRRQCELEYERRLTNFRRDWPLNDTATKEFRAAERTRLEEQWAREEKFRVARRPGISRIPTTVEMNIKNPASKVASAAINKKKKTKKQM